MPYAQNNETAQYVGARYVPKFYQNSQNPSSNAWEGNTAYEAMVIVTYNNSSYTSKQPVPAGIGNPAQNPTYWVNTGNYNAQVEEYRQETVQAVQTAQDVQNNLTQEIEKVEEYRQETVQAVQTAQDVQNNLTQEIKKAEEYRQETVQAVQTVQNNLTQEIENRENEINTVNDNIAVKVNDLKNQKFMILGDSYGLQAYPSGLGWPKLVKQYLGIADSNWIDLSTGGAGFTSTNPALNWGDMAENYQIDDPTSITSIIIAGGYNDTPTQDNTATIISSMETAIGKIKAKYTKANIYIAFIAWTTVAGKMPYLCYNYITYNKEANKLGCTFWGNIWFRLRDYRRTTSNGVFETIGAGQVTDFHPNAHGEEVLAEGFVNYITSGYDNLHYFNVSPHANATANMSPNSNNAYNQYANSNSYTFSQYNYGGYTRVQGNAPQLICDGIHDISLASFDDLLIHGSILDNITVAATLQDNDTNAPHNLNVTLWFDNNTLKLRAINYPTSIREPLTFNVGNINLAPWSLTVPRINT